MRKPVLLTVALLFVCCTTDRGADAAPPATPDDIATIHKLQAIAQSAKVAVPMRTAAIDALAKLNPKGEAVKALQAVLDDLEKLDGKKRDSERQLRYLRTLIDNPKSTPTPAWSLQMVYYLVAAEDERNNNKLAPKDLLLYHVLLALANIGPEANDALTNLMKINTDDPDVRKAIASTIAAIGAPTPKPKPAQTVTPALATTANVADAETAAYVNRLVQILKGNAPPAPPVPLVKFVPLGPPLLLIQPPPQNLDDCEQIKAANALGALGKDASCALKDLADVARTNPNAGLQAAANAALKKIKKALKE
jgi:hypothetical protein